MNISKRIEFVLDLGISPLDNESTKLNKRFLTYMALFMSGGGILWGVMCLHFGIFVQAIIPLSYTFLTGINLTYFYFTKKFGVVRVVQVLMSLLLPFMFQISLGGFIESGGVMLWAFLALVGSMTFQNLKQSAFWMGIYLSLTFLVSYFDSDFQVFSVHAPRQVQTLFLSINLAVISSIVFGLLVYFVNSRNVANSKLLQINRRLEDIVSVRTAEIVATNAKLGESNEELTALISQLEDKNHLIIEKNKHITDSLNYAKRIQKAILTNNETTCLDTSNHFVFIRPRDIVSGDFYWFHCIQSEKKVIVAVVDCTGHGVPGAFMSLIGDSLLNQVVIEHGNRDPQQILMQMDAGVNSLLKQEQQHGRDGMDMAIVIFDYGKMTLEFAGANSGIVIIADGKVEHIKGDNFPIGGISNITKEFNNTKLELKPSSMIYLFSDGYADQFGGTNNRKYLTKKFREFLLKIHDESMETQKRLLLEEHIQWKGIRPQTDDILVVGIKTPENLNFNHLQ